MGRLPPCSLESVFTKRIWMMSFSFSLITVSFEGRSSEVNMGLTAVSTCWLWSDVDSEVLSSMIGVSTNTKGGSIGFSASNGFGKSFLYLGGSHCGDAGRLSKTLLASSRKGKRWMTWLPSHSLQGNLHFLFYPETSLSLVDDVLSTWTSEVDDTGLCKRGDQSLNIRGMQGKSRW